MIFGCKRHWPLGGACFLSAQVLAALRRVPKRLQVGHGLLAIHAGAHKVGWFVTGGRKSRRAGSLECHAALLPVGRFGQGFGGGGFQVESAVGGAWRISQQMGTRRSQRVLDGVAHRLVYRAAVPETHFDLGGVHVHIDQCGVDLHEQRIGRLLVAVQHVFVGAARTVHDHFVAHKAAVHIGKLVVWARARSVWQTGTADHFERPGVVFDGYGLRHEVFAQHIGQALLQACCAGVHTPLLHQLAFVPNGEAHIRAG